MTKPYEIRPMSGLTCPGGQPTCHKIPYPHRGTIRKLLIKQMTGTIVNFQVDVYSRQEACEGDMLSDSDGSDTGLLSSPLYKVMPTLQSTTPGEINYWTENIGYHVFNQSPSTHDRTSMPKGEIYLRITPEGSGAKDFALLIGGTSLD